MRKLLFLLIFLSWVSAKAQTQEGLLLMREYERTQQWEKAYPIAQTFYLVNETQYFRDYFDCLMGLKLYDEAEKISKKTAKKYKLTSAIICLGRVYEVQEKPHKQEKLFSEAIKKLNPSIIEVNDLAKAFEEFNYLDYTAQTYQKGIELLGDQTMFGFELAAVYGRMGQISMMLEQYINLLEQNEGYFQIVKNYIQQGLVNDDNGLRKKELVKLILRKVQENPNKIVFSELMIWMMVQDHDYNSAVIQAKGLGLRINDRGKRLVEIGDLALIDNDFNAAVNAYQTVVGYGPGPFEKTAAYKLLNAEMLDITQPGKLDNARIDALVEKYKAKVASTEGDDNYPRYLKDLANLQAYYSNDLSSAASNLELAIEKSYSDRYLQAECKLDLGDVNIILGEVWESALIYGQVEKDFSMSTIGEEAKFRNGRLAFFNEDFEWAMAQFDVLKQSTSREIANDAMELSLFIQENIGEDSSYVPLQYMAKAKLSHFQHKYTEAYQWLDSIDIHFPRHLLEDDILWERSNIELEQKNWLKALDFLNLIVEKYPESTLADNALIAMANVYDIQLNDKPKAQQAYLKIIEQYQSSIFLYEAQAKYRKLRGDQTN